MYIKRITVYHENKKIDSMINDLPIRIIKDDMEKPKNSIENVTWYNLNEILKKYEHTYICLWVKQKKKGRVVNNSIKEWKTHSLNIMIKTTYEPYTPQLKELLDFYDSDMAIRYLVERGLSINV